MNISNLSNTYSYKTKINSFNTYYSSCLSFCSAKENKEDSFEKFKNWAIETNFLSKVKQIITNPANIMGSGFEGKVYQIPNSEDWVIKEYFRSNIIPKVNGESQIERVKDISPDLNIGQTIAKVNLPINDSYTETIFIHKKQTGKPIGVNSILMKSINDGTVKTHLQSLKAIADLPAETFNKLIDDIGTVSRLGYKIDGTTPNNILLDSEKQRFNFVDIADIDSDKNNQYSEVLYSLLGASFCERFFESDRPIDEKMQAGQFSDVIMKKFMTAMKEKNAQFSPTYNFYSLVNSTPFREFSKKSHIQ